MLAAQGLYLGAAMPLAGAVIESRQPGTASALFALTLATSIYTLVAVPVFNPRDSGHVIPRALAAVLIVIGFAAS
jgi:hypothetical protein